MSSLNPILVSKLIILGDDGVGKTTLKNRFMGKGFENAYRKTIGVDINHYRHKIQGSYADISIWDIAGEDSFKDLRKMYYKGIDAAIFVFDVTRELNIDTFLWWLEDIKQLNFQQAIPIAILGNKIDLVDQRIMNIDNIEGAADLLTNLLGNIEYKIFETSAKTGDGVKEAFNWVIKALLNKNYII